ENALEKENAGPRTPREYLEERLRGRALGEEDGRHSAGPSSWNCSGGSPGKVAHKSTTILLEGRRVKLEVWDASGQGRFITVLRSYSRGAQGILLVYDITNKWSFDSLDRWIKEIAEHAPGVPMVLVGNRLEYEFRRGVTRDAAEQYARKHCMPFLEVDHMKHPVASLQEVCCRTIMRTTTVYGIDQLPLPTSIKAQLKSYALTHVHEPLTPGYVRRKGASNSSNHLPAKLRRGVKRAKSFRSALSSSHAPTPPPLPTSANQPPTNQPSVNHLSHFPRSCAIT
ncbi:unnamed protein product, partial [Cyprideis torosa]